MVSGDRAVRDARTTESRLRDSRTESGREWPGNRLYGVSEKCIRHKPRERGENSTPRNRGGARWIRTRESKGNRQFFLPPNGRSPRVRPRRPHDAYLACGSQLANKKLINRRESTGALTFARRIGRSTHEQQRAGQRRAPA
jgi:hypothetical protein